MNKKKPIIDYVELQRDLEKISKKYGLFVMAIDKDMTIKELFERIKR